MSPMYAKGGSRELRPPSKPWRRSCLSEIRCQSGSQCSSSDMLVITISVGAVDRHLSRRFFFLRTLRDRSRASKSTKSEPVLLC